MLEHYSDDVTGSSSTVTALEIIDLVSFLGRNEINSVKQLMTAFTVSMETGEDELNVNSYGLRWSSHIPEQSEQVQMKTTWITTSTFIYTSLLLFL